MGGQGGAAARRGHIDGRSLRSSPRRGWSCDLPATLAPARHAAENRRFQLFVPIVLLQIDGGYIEINEHSSARALGQVRKIEFIRFPAD